MRKSNRSHKPQGSSVFLTVWAMFAALLLIVISSNSYALKGEPQAKLDTIVLNISGHALDTEVAVTPIERQRGLSYRQSLGADSGMLFVYREPRQLIFTMRETSIPLAIAFLDANFVILEILQMKPLATEHYPSQSPAQYGLEVNSGWFQKHGIKEGMRVELPKQQ